MNRMLSRAISWITRHEKQLVYGGGLIMVGLLCFVFGVLQGHGLSNEPITVMRPSGEPIILPCTNGEREEAAEMTEKDCKYVGSIKGSKYYPPSCSHAKKIAKENLRCFTSDEDAHEKGYQRSTSCN